MKNKKIITAGGTGFIGRSVAKYFSADNEIVILTRNVKRQENNAFGKFTFKTVTPNIRLVGWNGKDQGDWVNEIDGSDLVINLAGKSVNCRYTDTNKKEIFDSRTRATAAIGEAIGKSLNPPKLWINAASATIYRHATDRAQDEITGEIQNDFSVQVCKLWEKTFFEQNTPHTRKVAFRMAITLGNGGVMIPYFNLLKFGLGGRQGIGSQMYSWVHITDVCRCLEFTYETYGIEGVYNLSAPKPVTNKMFMKALRKAASKPFGLPAYGWMLKIGAALIGTEPELILKSRWVVPTKLLKEGFIFSYPDIDNALKEIVSKTPEKLFRLF